MEIALIILGVVVLCIATWFMIGGTVTLLLMSFAAAAVAFDALRENTLLAILAAIIAWNAVRFGVPILIGAVMMMATKPKR